MKRVVVEALDQMRTKFGICLMAYVVIPEHVHVLLLPHRRGEDQPISITDLLLCFKQHVGCFGKERLREVCRRDGRLWSDPFNRWAYGEFDKRDLMNTRGYDRNIVSESELR